MRGRSGPDRRHEWSDAEDADHPLDIVGQDLELVPLRFAFSSETYILSFALPNFGVDAVRAYAILRTRGLPILSADNPRA